MRRSIRSSLFLLVAPFALTFTLVAWMVSSKIGPWLAQPLIANCSDRGYSEWFCNLQAGLMPWLLLGAGVLILLSVTAILSLGLFRAHLNELQHNVLDVQKGHRTNLAADAPAEISPLAQLLNRILQAGAGKDPGHTAASPGESLNSNQNRPTVSRDRLQADMRAFRPEAPSQPAAPPAASAGPPPRDRHAAASRAPEPPPENPPAPAPAPAPAPDTEDLEVSLEELDADIDKALKEEPPRADPEPPEPDSPGPRPGAVAGEAPSTAGASPSGTGGDAPARSSRDQAFPTRKCRKLIAMLGHRYPDVNFDLITDVAESDPWTIREAELTEIFGQVLDNAGKWAKSQVNIFLAIKGNMLVFGVADDGPGVEADFMPHLGEEGFHTHADSPGRGLIAVRRALDAHGGSLAFDRSRLGGLEVIAAIPGSPLPRHVGSRGAYQ